MRVADFLDRHPPESVVTLHRAGLPVLLLILPQTQCPHPDGRRLFRVVQILGAAGRRRRELTKVNDRA